MRSLMVRDFVRGCSLSLGVCVSLTSSRLKDGHGHCTNTAWLLICRDWIFKGGIAPDISVFVADNILCLADQENDNAYNDEAECL
jgi:hypothetical protein